MWGYCFPSDQRDFCSCVDIPAQSAEALEFKLRAKFEQSASAVTTGGLPSTSAISLDRQEIQTKNQERKAKTRINQ